MWRRTPETIDEYVALLPHSAPDARTALDQVRRAVHRAVPNAEECISYKIPAFKLNGRILLYFAGWKEHFSIYPASDAMVAASEGELDVHRVRKGTLRFSLSEPVPVKLIGRIARFRVQEITKGPPAKKKKR